VTTGGARRPLAGLLLFVLVVAVYVHSVRFGFIYDDPILFAQTPVRRTLDGYSALFTEAHFSYLPYYRPVARLTFELQKLVHGSHAGAFHLFNALVAGLLASSARRVLAQRPFRARETFAWLGAALFALLPVVSSTVYPVVGRETLLSTTLVLTAVAGFLSGRPLCLAGAALAFAAALGCQEQAIVLPIMLVCLDLAGGVEGAAPRSGYRVARHAPFALVALAYLAVRARVLAEAPGMELAIFEDPLGPVRSIGFALTSIFAPTPGLAYEAPVEVWASAPRVAVAALLSTVFALLVWRSRRATRPVPVLCAALFVIALLPTSNLLVQETPFAERWLCLAAFPVVAALVATASAASGKAARVWTVGVSCLVLVAGALSLRRGFDHVDNRTFLTRWVTTNPRSAQARSSLGALLHGEGEVAVAELHLRKAIELSPNFADAHGSLGALLMLDGRLDEALPHLRLAVRLNNAQPLYQFNLGSGLARAGRLDAARRHLLRALQLAPGLVPAQQALAEVERLRADSIGSAGEPDR